jgi:hypothetical protein
MIRLISSSYDKRAGLLGEGLVGLGDGFGDTVIWRGSLFAVLDEDEEVLWHATRATMNRIKVTVLK